jgi:transposase
MITLEKPTDQYQKVRQERGIMIAALEKLARQDEFWSVPSATNNKKRYIVDPVHQTCTCPDHRDSGNKCKHIHAVEIVLQREGTSGTIKPSLKEEEKPMETIFTDRKPEPRNWHAYTKCAMNEKRNFQALLFDLCKEVKEPTRITGRNPVPMRDRLFTTIFKIYSTFSAMRFNHDLEEAHKKQYLSRLLHPNKISCLMEDERLTELLRSLIVKTSLPLKAIEKTFAVDATGFSCARYVQWINEKDETKRSGHDWVKVHVACGVKTHVVAAAVIKGRRAHEAPIFPALMKQVKENFGIHELCGDAAYTSSDNIQAVLDAGAMPYFDFRADATGGVGGAYERLFHLYRAHGDEYMRHYHQRSNVESVFSMLKRKFSCFVRSRHPVAMVNEAYGKLVCHNICCLLMSQEELGIDPRFWVVEESEPQAA